MPTETVCDIPVEGGPCRGCHRPGKGSDRVAAKAYADAHGKFWLPCPRCGEWFGGHEWRCGSGVQCVLEHSTFHGACCSKVSDEDDVQACRRSHERVGEPFPKGTA